MAIVDLSAVGFTLLLTFLRGSIEGNLWVRVLDSCTLFRVGGDERDTVISACCSKLISWIIFSIRQEIEGD